MNVKPTRRSPVQHLLEAKNGEWCTDGDCAVAVRFASVSREQDHFRTLGLCDASFLVKWGVKGPEAEPWLQEQSVLVPSGIYESCRLAGNARIVRSGSDEFFVEHPPEVRVFADGDQAKRSGVYVYQRHDATFLLTGSRALDVLAQTCGIEWTTVRDDTLVMTRLAGVSAAIQPQRIDDVRLYRIWIDPSYAVYLWEVLERICQELGGSVIGTAVACPELKAEVEKNEGKSE